MLKKLLTVSAALAFSLALGCAESDAGIANKIKVKIDADRDLTGSQVQVTSSERIVTLSGTTPGPLAHEKILKYARETEGVRDVQDRITVVKATAPQAVTPEGAPAS